MSNRATHAQPTGSRSLGRLASGLSVVCISQISAGACRAPESALPSDEPPPESSTTVDEDFEHWGARVPDPWRIAGRVESSQQRARSGQRSLHLRADADWDGRAFLELHEVPEVLRESHYGRIMSYVPRASPDGVHWNHIVVGGTAESPAHGSLAADIAWGGMHAGRWLANFDTPGGYDGTGPKSDCWQDSRVVFPTGRWACIEWQLDRREGAMRLWVDGHPIDSMTVQGRGQGCVHPWNEDWAFPRFESLVVGWVEFGNDAGPRELWIDDLALAPTRVGCPGTPPQATRSE